MTKEVNINLGDKSNSNESSSRSCLGGCPPNPMDILEGIGDLLPMILGVMLTGMKMDQFQRPLANTAMTMIEGLAPQIEKNATQVADVINSLSEATHNVNAKMTKHDYDFTTEDKVHLIKMLINEDNYLDSYDAVIDFIKYQRPGFIKALYKSLLANSKEGEPIHSESNKAKSKEDITQIGHQRPSASHKGFDKLRELDNQFNKEEKETADNMKNESAEGLRKRLNQAHKLSTKRENGKDKDPAAGAQGPAGNDGAAAAQGPAGNDGAAGAQGP